MKYKILILLFTFIVSIFTLFAQDFPAYIKANTVNIDKPDSLNNEVWQILKDYMVIMVGEMHGTNEPAKFVMGLARLFSSRGDNVQIGLEIPPAKMTKYLNHPTDSSIYSSDFFAEKSTDGRASQAWAEVISRLDKNPEIHIFFFDVNNGECKSPGERDSLMYLKIKNKIEDHPNWKTITLSGNMHNMILPYKEKTKTALYLARDKELNLSGRICCLNHQYGSGTMLNNTGNGLELHPVDNSFSDYSKAVDEENYLLLFQANDNNRYNGVFYTRTVTAAKMLK